MDRAREGMPSVGGNYVSSEAKEELVRSATPLAITDINYDPTGSGQFMKPRWLINVRNWYDEDAALEGVISLDANPVRNHMFTKLQEMLDEVEARGENELGPVCLIKIKGKNGRPYAFADFDEQAGVPLTPEEPQANGKRPRSRQVTADDTRPVAQTRQSTGQLQRQRPQPQPEAEEEAAPEPRRRGRPPKATSQAQAPTSTPAAPVTAVLKGEADCPHCGERLHGRVFPNDDSPDAPPVMTHQCPTSGRMEVLEAVLSQ